MLLQWAESLDFNGVSIVLIENTIIETFGFCAFIIGICIVLMRSTTLFT